MPKFKVWNDNVYPYSENFKGDPISIPSKDFILMEEDDAIAFRGSFVSPKKDEGGTPMPQGYKMIRLEKYDGVTAEKAKPVEHVCMACKYKATSEKDLLEHSKVTHSEITADAPETDEDVEVKRRGRPSRAS
jgi:hypothetical protein